MSIHLKTLISNIILTSSITSHLQAKEKIVIAHRGASGYLPEHTLPAKAMAYAQGADYLEQDLVMTKDDQLIVLHDHYLDHVTNVAEKFPERARKDGRYYAIDFTLQEIKSLEVSEVFTTQEGKKVQVYPRRFPMGKFGFRVHTFQDEIRFIQGLNHLTGKNIGIYPEIKAPWFHHQEGRDISIKVLEVLKQYGYISKNDKVYLQSFNANKLKRIKNELQPKLGMDLKLIQLVAYSHWNETYEQQDDKQWVHYSYDWMLQPGAMQKIAEYADGIGPAYPMLIADTSTQKNIVLTNMAREAHANNLAVHPFTLRADVLPNYAANINQLFDILYNQADVEAAFTDFPDMAVQFLHKQGQHK